MHLTFPTRFTIGFETLDINRSAPVQNDSWSCGYWVVKIVLEYFDKNITEFDLISTLETNLDGTRQNKIVKTLRKNGISANIVRRQPLSTFERAIDKKKLVIIYDHGIDHWMLLYGHSIHEIAVYCPERGPTVWRTNDLQGCFNGFGIVCDKKSLSSPTVKAQC